jgi:hypothetical protein
MRVIVACIVFLTACAAQAQDVVKCQDQNGNTVYVDRPCSLYGLRDVGPVKDRTTVAPAQPSTEPAAAPPAPSPSTAEEPVVPRSGAKPRLSARQRAAERCRRNRGADCESDEGLREWLVQDKPPTEEERQTAIGARRLRERCEKTQYSTPECELLKLCESIQVLSTGMHSPNRPLTVLSAVFGRNKLNDRFRLGADIRLSRGGNMASAIDNLQTLK